MNCPKCNTDNPSDSKHCKECGTQLTPAEKISLTQTKIVETPIEELSLGSIFAVRYQIIEELGMGGMGRVYRTLDKKLNEEVALKLIKPEIALDKQTVERFSNELKIARKIVHKNVGRMYELMEDEGTHFITMEYVPGEDLKSFIRRSRHLAVETAITIAKQVCEGLAEAHRLGVIHRDLKPSNIMIDKEGNARIVDFGIARSLKEKGITGSGVMIGTPDYMSPEQAEAKEVDQRSDIYSLGVILYEMVTGHLPFEGDTALSIAMKHKSETPPNPKWKNAQIPESLSRVILTCMEKDRERRYQSSEELLSELSKIEEARPEATRISEWENSIAVLPFKNMSADPENEYFSDGITEDLIAQISKIRDLKVISRTSTMRYKGADKALRVIGEELGVATILEGSVRRSGNRVRVVAQLIDAESDEHLWAETYDRELTDVFAIQSEVALQVAAALQTALSAADRARVRKEPTKNMEAYDLYILGRHQASMRSDDGLRWAVEYFGRALEKDPEYAAACAGLADAYVLSGLGYRTIPPRDAMVKAKEFALKALTLDDTLPEAHAALGYVHLHEWDWPRALAEFDQAIALNPSYTQAHQWRSHYLIYVRDFHAALAEAERARELDPLSVAITNEVGWAYFFMRQPERARPHHERAREMDPSFAIAHYNIAQCYAAEGRYSEAIPTYQRAAELLGGRPPFIIALLAGAYARSSRTDDARAILHELLTTVHRAHGVELWIAYVYEALGEPGRALEWLERAFEAHAPFLVVIDTEWAPFESVRDDARFLALLNRMGLGNAPRAATDPRRAV